MHIATVSSQRQITIPEAVLRELGLGKKGKLRLTVKDEVLEAWPVTESVTSHLAGSLTKFVEPNKRNLSVDEIHKLVKKVVAKRLAHD